MSSRYQRTPRIRLKKTVVGGSAAAVLMPATLRAGAVSQSISKPSRNWPQTLNCMPRYVVLLRGVNLAKRNRVSMPGLRSALEAEGFRDVSSYVQSGNLVLTSRASQERISRDVRALINKRFGLDIAVLVRSHNELSEIVRRNPLSRDASDPKHYLVTFMSRKVPAELVERIRAAADAEEKFTVIGREVFSWHPAGVGRSPLWERLGSKVAGIDATSRNWATVTTLLEMAKPTTGR